MPPPSMLDSSDTVLQPRRSLDSPSPVASSGRFEALDTLRGIAIAAMSLQHAAFFLRAPFQAETYGGQAANLMSWPYWVSGLAVDLNAPTFWLLIGLSVPLMVGKYRRLGWSQTAVSLQMLKRAGVLAALDLTICDWAWRMADPPVQYTHVLLSLAIALALLSVVRLMPRKALAALTTGAVVTYQFFLGQHVSTWSEADGFWTALLVGYRTMPAPAFEFALCGWFPLVCVGFLLGTGLSTERFRRAGSWLVVGGTLLTGWLVLRWLGGFGDLTPYRQGQEWYYFLIMNKTPITLTYVLFYWGISSLLMAGLIHLNGWTHRPPFVWFSELGRASLFVFVGHIAVYSLLSIPARTIVWPVPRVLVAYGAFSIGMALLIPAAAWYSRWRRLHPEWSLLP